MSRRSSGGKQGKEGYLGASSRGFYGGSFLHVRYRVSSNYRSGQGKRWRQGGCRVGYVRRLISSTSFSHGNGRLQYYPYGSFSGCVEYGSGRWYGRRRYSRVGCTYRCLVCSAHALCSVRLFTPPCSLSFFNLRGW